MMRLVLQQTTEVPMENASASIASGMSSGIDLIGVTILVLWVVVIMGLLSAARNSEYFARLVDAADLVGLSVYYAIHGFAAVTAIAVLTAPVYFVVTADGSTQTALMKFAGYGILAYVILAGVGYVFKHHVVDPIYQNADENGLFPEADETVEEAGD